MKRIITLASILVMAQAHSLAQTKNETSALQSAVEQNLSENILPFWTQNTVDPDGGFYGTVVDKGNAVTDAERGAILNARILWTYARAYRQYAIPEYRAMADRAAEYYIRHFIDPKFEVNPKSWTGSFIVYCHAKRDSGPIPMTCYLIYTSSPSSRPPFGTAWPPVR